MRGQKNRTEEPTDLVVCCDGTWAGDLTGTNTTIKIIADCFDRANGVLVKYFAGVGVGAADAHARLSQFILDGATAITLDNHILEAYKFIVDNFKLGMRVWLFGFSRGAYTVRCVAGLIKNCGILKKEAAGRPDDCNLDLLICEAYKIYRSRDPMYHPRSDFCQRFRLRHSHNANVPIRFMGLLDTVAAHGLPRLGQGHYGGRYELHDQVVSSEVQSVAQALATHDMLTFFEPVFVRRSARAQDLPTHTLHEVWFPGCHTDIGNQRFVFGRRGVSWRENIIRWVLDHTNLLGINVRPQPDLARRVGLWMLRRAKDASDGRQLLPSDERFLEHFKEPCRSWWWRWWCSREATLDDMYRHMGTDKPSWFSACVLENVRLPLKIFGVRVPLTLSGVRLPSTLFGDRHIPLDATTVVPVAGHGGNAGPRAQQFHKLRRQDDAQAEKEYQTFTSQAFDRYRFASLVPPQFVSDAE